MLECSNRSTDLLHQLQRVQVGLEITSECRVALTLDAVV